MKLKFILLFLMPFAVNSQNITGFIYDAKSVLKDIKIFNTSKKIMTYSDDTGTFTIKASINDTLVFSSLFYEEKKEILTKTHFEDNIVIELKEILNNLNEVVISNDFKPKAFSSETYIIDLKTQIANDIKDNPHLYGQQSTSLDLLKIASLIVKLFKKEKIKTEAVKPITYKQLDSLFTEDKFFTNTFLIQDLKIPLEYKNLFFEIGRAHV